VPNSKVCVGGGKATGVNSLSGTIAEGTCTANGMLPPTPGCAADAGAAGCCQGAATCRRNGGGAVLGCVECVGPNSGNNERNLYADTQCREDDGGPGANAVRTCTANNTWGTPTACPTGLTCVNSPSFLSTCQ
jgi:hypothetical protein